MKNPALVLLYALPTIALAIGAFMWVKAAVDHSNFDVQQLRVNMAAIIGDSRNLPTDDALIASESLRVEQRQNAAAALMTGSAAGFLVPLSVTALGRSQKNAARELAETLRKSE